MSINEKEVSIPSRETSILKKIRLWSAVFVLTAMSLLFVGALPLAFAFLGKLQLVPAIFAGSLAIVVAIIAVTFAFGRAYCSIICPLGLMQDAVSRLGKKRRFQFTQNIGWLRLIALALFVVAAIFGFSSIVSILEPYSAFGRIASELITPAWAFVWNAVLILPEAIGIYLVSAPQFVWAKGAATTIIAFVTLLAVGLLAYKGGRIWCNTICPVGTVLGFIAKHSLFKIRIVTDNCVDCGMCARTCKASCMDVTGKAVDASRCVLCFNCLESCHRGAVVYAPPTKKTDAVNPDYMDRSRRNFLGSTLGIAAVPLTAVIAAKKSEIMSLAGLEQEAKYSQKSPILPPGVWDFQQYRKRCTSCQLCVSACPSHVLHPYERDGMSQPSLSFERGYCWEDCVACSNVCPTSAISPISIAEKSAIQIGRAVHDRQLCTVCETCVQNCPNDAIVLTSESDGTEHVTVDTERCVGCGACEYFCPQAAVKVQGVQEHHRLFDE